jgi:hypothetical protein
LFNGDENATMGVNIHNDGRIQLIEWMAQLAATPPAVPLTVVQ